jgi:dolichol-phosphate mannosyltransferase
MVIIVKLYFHIMRVAIVIPTYKESSNISRLIESTRNRLTNSGNELHFVVVDDNSPDGTADVVKDMARKQKDVHLILRPTKMGLGSAYTDAFRWILVNLPSSDVVVQMDADLSHPPELVQKMIDAISDGADFVIASRYVGMGGGVDSWPLRRRLISKGANTLARFFLGIGIKDVTSGFRAIKIDIIRELLASNLSSKGYEYQVESAYAVSKLGRGGRKKNNNKGPVVVEVPFVFRNRVSGQSKLTMKEILRFIKTVARLRMNALLASLTEEKEEIPRILSRLEHERR